jgi:transposase-like protein
VEVRRPKLRDRGAEGDEPIRFTSAILPAYLRRTRNLEELLPWLYLKGVSTGQFGEALAALLGPDAPGLSASTVRRLTEAWQEEHARWQRRDLSARRYVYLWADGVHFTPRLEHERQCLLVLIGADAAGRKELLAIEDGYRESAQGWRELLLRLRDENGLVLDPELATGDGALGFWQALHEVWPKTRQQRCWVHKAANVLNKLPPSLQGKAKQDLHAIYEAENRRAAEGAFDRFLAKYMAKYDKAAACLAKDREVLLTFYDFPAEHWKHVRTTNPIESTFATVRLRTDQTKGCLSRQTALAMVYKLTKLAERSWRRLDGSQRLAQVIQGVRFRDGEPVQTAEDKVAA